MELMGSAEPWLKNTVMIMILCIHDVKNEEFKSNQHLLEYVKSKEFGNPI